MKHKPTLIAIDDAGQVLLDPMRLIDSRALACTNSGGGKSHLIRRIVEQILLLAVYPCIILDREGEFSTLRERFDVVLVGEGGELPCAVSTAAKLARKLIELRCSAVIDLSALSMPDKRRFVRLFLEALIALPRALWRPTLIVIDEAHQFAPESGREAESLPAVVSLMDQGRKRGFGAILATQRLAKLHKDAAAEANNLFMGRVAQDVDLKRAIEYLGLSGREGASTIRTFRPGEFFALGPALDVDGVVRFRSGEVLTTHPDPQDRHTIEPPAPSGKILAFAVELAELEEQVQAEQTELEALRAKVAEQADALAKRGKATAPTEGEIEDRISAAVEDRLAAAEEAAYIRGRVAALERVRDRVSELLSSNASTIISESPEPAFRAAQRREPSPPTPKRAPETTVRGPARRSRTSSSSSGAGPRSGYERVLVALRMHPEGLSREGLGIYAVMSSEGGGYRKVLSHLATEGKITTMPYPKITPAGKVAAQNLPALPLGAKLVDAWREKVAGSGAGLSALAFDAISGAGAQGMSRDELAAAIGAAASGGGFRKVVSVISKPGCIVTGKRIRLHDVLLRETAR